MLAGALRDCPDRLEADLLRFYGLDLDDLWEGRRSVRAVANATAHLPRGGAVGEWYGGRLAVSPETEALWENTHVLAQVNSKKKVKPRSMPEGVSKAQAKQRHVTKMAEKYIAKHGRGGGGHGQSEA